MIHRQYSEKERIFRSFSLVSHLIFVCVLLYQILSVDGELEDEAEALGGLSA